MSVPNQNIVIIHQSKEEPFIKIGKKEWKAAFTLFKKRPRAMALFMYLAGNQEGFPLEMSEVAYENATGMSRSSYYRAQEDLEEVGYLYRDTAGRLNFRTNLNTEIKRESHFGEASSSRKKHSYSKSDTEKSQGRNNAVSHMNREKDNKDNKEIKEKASSNDFSYLKEIITPSGEYISGPKKGKWLEDEVPNLWRLKDFSLYSEIAKCASFTVDEAVYITHHILDADARRWAIREEDFYQSTSAFYNAEDNQYE